MKPHISHSTSFSKDETRGVYSKRSFFFLCGFFFLLSPLSSSTRQLTIYSTLVKTANLMIIPLLFDGKIKNSMHLRPQNFNIIYFSFFTAHILLSNIVKRFVAFSVQEDVQYKHSPFFHFLVP